MIVYGSLEPAHVYVLEGGRFYRLPRGASIEECVPDRAERVGDADMGRIFKVSACRSIVRSRRCRR